MASKKSFDFLVEDQSHAPRIVRNCPFYAMEMYGTCSKKIGLTYILDFLSILL